MEDLSLHLLDIMENSIEADAHRIDITIDEDLNNNLLTLEISDDGKGMDTQMLKMAADPFFTTRKTRRFGLGLSMISESARATGGELTLESKPGKGTCVRAVFHRNHIDMKPLGDIPKTLLTVIFGHPEIDLSYHHVVGMKEFSFTTMDYREAPINSPNVLRRLAEIMRKGIDGLKIRGS
ncbi:MAG: sensor histidine kinase [Deltaproteobacteria bacterium]|nr:sensor histidine kinase [Deltaproteobacteria bacterium]